jgi:hypothetical protein
MGCLQEMDDTFKRKGDLGGQKTTEIDASKG